jgi:ABC-2 type transport system permease protein
LAASPQGGGLTASAGPTSSDGIHTRGRSPRTRTLAPGGVAAIVRRDYLITRSYKLAFGFDLFYGVIELGAYFFISRTFLGVHPGHLHGAPTYFAFAAVGIAVATVVDAAVNDIGRRIRDEQLTGTLEVLAAQPVSSTGLCLGLVGFAFSFALVRGLAYLVIAAAWIGVDLSRASWPGLVLVLLSAGAAMTALGVVSAALVLVLKRGHVLASSAMFVLTLLGGSVFPISALPGWLQPVSRVLPTRFAFDGVRGALFEGRGWGIDALALLLTAVVGIPIGLFVFERALRLTKRQGSLGQY